jgi:hypothetical protein
MTNGTRRFLYCEKTKTSGTGNDLVTMDNTQHVYTKWRNREAEALSVVTDC